ncbi:hypothetical protein [uncultured Brevundimonas sp.]|uniref:hypothetical protein n=1 Tax=uncultured Brevundimonas sp. TaxID=213418 RepID=UPI0030EF587F|tara:strand:- start:1423 stop:1821 length:399 start_codon:yes stop_codon:yes gene_type:complete
MSAVPPESRFTADTANGSEGKVAALAAWVLFILSIPSANILVLVGLVVAYAGRDSATGIGRAHIEAQIQLFWSVFWWTIACWIAIAVSAVASLALIGIPFLFLFFLLWFLITVWFTVKSVFGLLRLLQDKAP